MTALDIVVLVLVGVLAVLGLMRGFVAEALSLVAWVLAIAAVKFLYAPVQAWLLPKVGSTSGAAALAVVLTFGVVFVAGKLAAARLGKHTRQSILGPFDRVLGGGFGALKGLFAATLLFLLASLASDVTGGDDEHRPEWMATSRTYPLLRASAATLVRFVDERRHSRG